MIGNNELKETEQHRENKLFGLFTRSSVALWCLAVAVIMFLLLFFHESTDYRFKILFGLSNALLAVIALVTASLICALYAYKKEAIDRVFRKITFKYLLLATAILLALQLIVYYNVYFKTGWDVRAILEAAEAIASGATETNAQKYYYIRYPNNLLMTGIFSGVIWFCNALGLTSEFQHIFAIIIIQCVLFAVSSILLFKAVSGIVKNPVLPFFAWGLYWLNVGFNPNLTIPYSDSLSLIVPLAVFCIYRSEVSLKLKWTVIAVLSVLGYLIKPQAIIMLIAVTVAELVRFLTKYDSKKKIKHCIGYSIGISAFALAFLICKLSLAQLPVQLDKNYAFGFPHFIMMGLNEDVGGAYSAEDVEFSGSFSSAKERNSANLKVIKERLKDFGVVGLSKFMAKKCMTNFGNGTYAWSLEGEFYLDVPEAKNDTLSPFLRSYYYDSGENYLTFITFQQYLWIIILIGNLGIIFVIRDKKTREAITVPVLALIGLTMFEMIFEARARYLFNYSGIFIITAAIGWYAILKTTVKIIRKRKNT